MAQSNNHLLLLIKCRSKVKAFNQLQSPFNESIQKFVDIIDIVYEKKMFIQYIAENQNFLLGGLGMWLYQSLKFFLLMLTLI